jgi:hypothetical protein
MTGTREIKPEGYARCGNRAHSTTATFFHASAADVRACYALAANGWSQTVLDALADHVTR